MRLFQFEWFPLVFLPVNRCVLHYIIHYWFLCIFLLDHFILQLWLIFEIFSLCYTSHCVKPFFSWAHRAFLWLSPWILFQADCLSPWFLVAFLRFYLIASFKNIPQDFPDGPVVKIPPSNAGNTGSISGQGNEITYAIGQLSLNFTAAEPKHCN